MDIATVFEWFAEESKSIAEQETEPAQREKFVKLASLQTTNSYVPPSPPLSIPPLLDNLVGKFTRTRFGPV